MQFVLVDAAAYLHKLVSLGLATFVCQFPQAELKDLHLYAQAVGTKERKKYPSLIPSSKTMHLIPVWIFFFCFLRLSTRI